MKKILLSLICSVVLISNAYAFDTKARSAYLLDYNSGAVIYDKDADELMPPSSMLKLMTLAVVFDAIKDGNLEMTEMLPVSENADYQNPIWNTASKICLSKGQKISVSDAIQGLIVLSGGDAGVVLAEKLAGSESAFTAQMLKKARAIGMKKSTFGNATGLPTPDNLMTSRELAMLAQYLIENHQKFYPMFSERRFEFTDYKSNWCRDWGRTHTLNYNKLLFIMPGSDGLKTGHTDEGGYGMVASSIRGGRRLIGVINGFRAKNHDALAIEMKKLLEYGYQNTTSRTFYKSGDNITKIPVWYGRQKFAIATIDKDFAITLRKNQNISGLEIVARYNEPVPAPIHKGQKIGEMIATINGQIVARAPLISKEKVGRVWFIGKIAKNLSILFGGK